MAILFHKSPFCGESSNLRRFLISFQRNRRHKIVVLLPRENDGPPLDMGARGRIF
jgi:hypothetical protein